MSVIGASASDPISSNRTMAQAVFLLAFTFFAVQVNAYYGNELDSGSNFPLENDFMDTDFERTRAYYRCEVNETLPAESALCNYRGDFFVQPVYHVWANWGCYYWTQPNLMNSSAPKANATTCVYNNMALVPCFLIQSPTGPKCYQIDERIPEVLKEIRRTLISESAVNRWLRCTAAAGKCCSDVMANSKPDNDSCPATWDAWSCFHPQKAGEVSRGVCPEFAYSNTGPACFHYSQKECFENATWNKVTDYTTCSITPRLVTRVNVHVACLGVSIVLCAPAVLLLACYRRLRVRRLALHRNLLAAILIRNVLVIISKSVVVQDELTSASGHTVMSRNEFPCKLLASLEKLAASAVFTCMLVDGIFLHRSIVAVFKRELNIKLVFSLAAAATFIPVIIWICLMATMNDSNCWIVYSTPGIQWILDGPRIAMLAVNTLLLFDILRIILTKLRRNENSNNLSTTKATLFLMPLFGVQFLLTAWRPATTSCELEQGYYFFTYIMDGLQGLMVAVWYCYLNKEVHTLIRATYKKTENVVSTRFRSDPKGRRSTAHKIDVRRDTFTTMVDNKQNQEDEDARNGEADPQYDAPEPRILPSLNHLDNGIDEDVPKTEAFIPSDLSLEVNSDNANSLTILNNAYCPSDDGYINLDFEYDVAPKVSHRLSLKNPPRSSKNDFLNAHDRLDVNSFGTMNPDTGCDVWSDNPNYEKAVTNTNATQYDKLNFAIKPRTTLIDYDCPHFSGKLDNSRQRNAEKEDIFKIPDTHDYEIVTQNQIPKTYIENEDISDAKKSDEGFENFNSLNDKLVLSDEPKKSINYSSSFADFSLPTDIVENIDALGIFEDIFKKTSLETGKKDGDDDWGVILDPVKFCPNRSKDDKIYFIND